MNSKQSNNRVLKGIPGPSLKRLPDYLHYLKIIRSKGIENISSSTIANDLKLDSTQIVKDLSYTDVAGKTRVGYNVNELIKALEEYLGLNAKNDAFLVGTGNLGTALLSYQGFKEYGVRIVAAFDVAPKKVNSQIGDIHVLPINKLGSLIKRLQVKIGIITTPASEAQKVAEIMYTNGIEAIWNFAPVALSVPDHIVVQNTSIYSNLAVLLKNLQSKQSS